MTPQELQYVQRTIERHIEFHFHEKAVASYKAADIAWIEWDAVCGEGWSEDALIIIPIVPKDLPRQVTWNVPFRDTSLFFGTGCPFQKAGNVIMTRRLFGIAGLRGILCQLGISWARPLIF